MVLNFIQSNQRFMRLKKHFLSHKCRVEGEAVCSKSIGFMWNFPIKIITDLRSKSCHSKFSKFRFSFPFSFMQFSWGPNGTYQPRSTQIQRLPTKGIPISWFQFMTYSLHLLITIIIHKSINNDMNGNKIRNSISKLRST